MDIARVKNGLLEKIIKINPSPTFSKIGILLILLGILTISFPRVYKERPQIISKSKNYVAANEPIKIDPKLLSKQLPSQPPTRIIIPLLNIDLAVVEAEVVDGYWETSETSASHGVGSANPGQIGNTVIFAHARAGLFLPLKEIKTNNLIYVLTKDRWYRYKVTEIKEVLPSQLEVIAPTSDETLTLYTCSGFLDEKRLIVVAKPSGF